jgi:hypothetical protein
MIHIKPYKELNINKLASTHRECRTLSNPQKEIEIKRIRPWSTSKNWETKLSMF